MVDGSVERIAELERDKANMAQMLEGTSCLETVRHISRLTSDRKLNFKPFKTLLTESQTSP